LKTLTLIIFIVSLASACIFISLQNNTMAIISLLLASYSIIESRYTFDVLTEEDCRTKLYKKELEV